ncbi:MAG: primosomal protein N' [Spirochaetota bacterium]|nr:primosomal protein N' [Spirochaetota bacterium]
MSKYALTPSSKGKRSIKKSENKDEKIKLTSLYVNLVFNLPLEKSFTYKVSKEHSNITVGQRVLAPFNNQDIMGYVIKVHEDKPSFKCKLIKEIYDDIPIFDEKIIQLANWLSEFYLCSLGEALAVCVPKEIKEKSYNFEKVETEALLTLNEEQKLVVDSITNVIKDSKFISYLISGITGSGKTEVYKYLACEVVSRGKQALILVPEIALTPQTIRRFQSSFGKKIAVLHSKLNSKEKLYNWRLIQKGEVDIILGARSAIFAPMNKLGIIIIDEEHETTYKSGDTPRYHTRQVAYKICQMQNIPLVMGSATPSIESYYYAQHGRIKLFHLANRHSSFKDQIITLVDMRVEKSNSFISETLFKKISERLINKEQVIIFLNRRGYSPLLICHDCGHTVKCINCDISLTYHQGKKLMRCHYCDYSQTAFTICPNCESKNISFIGYGTERIDDVLKEMFISANIARMDLDTTRRKGSHEKILSDFQSGKIDILIGTQMIAKGLHFPNVTLVGIPLADLSMNLPDFRASERTFSLITQVSGRSGRGDIQGEVVIQTYIPNNYVIQSAKNQDYNLFYQHEIEDRKKLLYPPFSRFIKLLIRGKSEETVISKINDLSITLKGSMDKETEILGPAPSPLSKLNNNYRWQMILKSKKIANLQKLAKIARESFKNENRLYLEIDVDPISMM